LPRNTVRSASTAAVQTNDDRADERFLVRVMSTAFNLAFKIN